MNKSQLKKWLVAQKNTTHPIFKSR